jgi:hypothetical protein
VFAVVFDLKHLELAMVLLSQAAVQKALALPDTAEEGHLSDAIRAACEKGDTDLVSTLLRDGADARHQDEETGLSPLIVAASKGHAAAVQLLLSHGVPWNAQDKSEMSAGDHALAGEHGEVRCVQAPGCEPSHGITGIEQRT